MGMTRNGHTLNRQRNGTVFVVTCVCGWRTEGLVGSPDGAEELAYEHLTGDVATTDNQARMKAAGLFAPTDFDLAKLGKSIIVPSRN